MAKNNKKRKSSVNGQHQHQQPQPEHQPQPPPPPHIANATHPTTAPTIKSGIGHIDGIIAFVLALFAYANSGKGHTHKIEVLLLAILTITILYFLTTYLISPLLSYPLTPIKWLLRKVWSVVRWVVVDWVVWGVKMMAWCAFYLHFAGKFVDGVVWGLERGLDRDEHTPQVEVEVEVDDSEPPPLVRADE